MLKLFRCCTTIRINNKKTLSGGSASVICPDLHSQSQWQSTIQMSESWHWNMSCLCVLSISNILPGSFSLTHHLSPKGRILEESLIIFTAHSIIPAKRLIHDLPQWRPTPQSQREKEAKQGTKSAPVQKMDIVSDIFYYFEFLLVMRSKWFCQRGRKHGVTRYDGGFICTPAAQKYCRTVITDLNAVSSDITVNGFSWLKSNSISESFRKRLLICS